MNITSAQFKAGLKGSHPLLFDGTPQIAFIGRSNAGKSSLINSLTGTKDLARTSRTPGRTQEINLFEINNSHYFLDLPGYGYAKVDGDTRHTLSTLIYWYIFDSNINQKIVLLIDAEIGPTVADLDMLHALEEAGKNIIIVLNKVDKIKQNQYASHLKKLATKFAGHQLFPYSSSTKLGREALIAELLK